MDNVPLTESVISCWLIGNVRAFDETLPSGPIAEQIVAGLLKQKDEAAKAVAAAHS